MSTQTTAQKDVKNVKNVETLKVVPAMVSEEKKESIKTTLEKFRPNPAASGRKDFKDSSFEELSKRYNLLKSKSEDLKMFTAGNDKTNAKIIFKNAQGFEFEIRNSNVIEDSTACTDLTFISRSENRNFDFRNVNPKQKPYCRVGLF